MYFRMEIMPEIYLHENNYISIRFILKLDNMKRITVMQTEPLNLFTDSFKDIY